MLVESEAEGFDREEALYEFAGVDSTMTFEQLEELLQPYENVPEIRCWPICTSFLGVEVKSGEFVYAEGGIDARRQLKVAERFASRSQLEIRFRVHPAYRAFPEVCNDDLHNKEIRDVT
ncbi:hypothetical protein [Pseudarthrobacter sp. PS3-L1]|uniref:hypothetical protein n=1 Tax=Pseudarthrobacter sp. PS3-L1 TaxID=3046207 RepID=UPI0024BBD20E|nr:hypothetical protein [Pseudarthrobacter sp. PS3-L1]MDJ0321954.1 hypothetical protein [Pseudarthrobacter sp. PS3-L1]